MSYIDSKPPTLKNICLLNTTLKLSCFIILNKLELKYSFYLGCQCWYKNQLTAYIAWDGLSQSRLFLSLQRSPLWLAHSSLNSLGRKKPARMSVKQVVTFDIKKDLDKFKVKAAEVVNLTRVGIVSLFIRSSSWLIPISSNWTLWIFIIIFWF